MQNAAVIVAAFLGGGGIIGLVALLLKYRSENARTEAEGRKFESEGAQAAAKAEAALSDAMQRRYEGMFDDLEQELKRIRGAESKCRKDLDTLTVKYGRAIEQIGGLRIEAANATADVKLARGEIVRLQDHLDRLEARVNGSET